MMMPRVDFDARLGRPSQIEREVLDLIELRTSTRQRLGYDRPIRVEPETRQGFFDHRCCHAFAMRFGVEIDLELRVRVRREPDRQTSANEPSDASGRADPHPLEPLEVETEVVDSDPEGARAVSRLFCSEGMAPNGSTKNLSSGLAPRVSENSKGVWSSPIGEGQVGLRPTTVSPQGDIIRRTSATTRRASEPNSSAVHSRTSFAEQSSDNVETQGCSCVENGT